MFCPRARLGLLGVGVCAVLSGCADRAPVTEPESAMVSGCHTSVISADVNAPLAGPVTLEEIISWSVRGVRDDVIIDRLQHSGSVFHLSADREIHLRDAGVSEEVIRAMKATAS